MSLQLNFSNITTPLDSRFTQFLSALLRQECADDAKHMELVFQFPDFEDGISDIFLLHTRAAEGSTHLIEKLYCIRETKQERFVWAYIGSGGDLDSPLVLHHGKELKSVDEVLHYWQSKTLTNINNQNIDIDVNLAAIEEANKVALHLAG
ncbi:hypothetical protein ACFOEW_15565 [Alteromonas oceani]|uniref:Uncharacterized protein n=1 Tax=Alteromonas oceani TaxID=2071609 RepID=A0ABV7JYZ8_9ALTE|nr:hypothetical protein [Alteromonas oceani]